MEIRVLVDLFRRAEILSEVISSIKKFRLVTNDIKILRIYSIHCIKVTKVTKSSKIANDLILQLVCFPVFSFATVFFNKKEF